MILTVDIGNSTTNIGLYDGAGKQLFRGAVKTDRAYTRDQLAIGLLDIFHLYRHEIQEVSGAILASVVPPVTAPMEEAIRALTGKKAMTVGPGMKTGMNILAEIHNQLGADIVASSVAALQKYPQPVIVVDMGTATTMSFLSGETYEGCAIIPGVRVSVEALVQRAAELPHISVEPPPTVLGRSTIDAMRAGVLYGTGAMVDSMVARMEEAAKKPAATVVMTGGSAAMIRPYCRREIVLDDNLILDGLFYLYQKNQERRRKKQSDLG